MAQMGRLGLSAAQKSELWERWKGGQSLSEIGLALGKRAASIFGVLAHHGGIYRPPRRRAARVLSLAEREEISRGIAAGSSMRNLARAVGRSPATISREVARNGGRPGYRAAAADQQAWQRA